MWINGGPGATSAMGLFLELGEFERAHEYLCVSGAGRKRERRRGQEGEWKRARRRMEEGRWGWSRGQMRDALAR